MASGQRAIEKRYEAQFATSPRKLVRKRRVDCFGLAAIRSATDRNWSVVTRRPESSAPGHFWYHLEKLGWRLEPSSRVFFEEYLEQSYYRLWSSSQLFDR